MLIDGAKCITWRKISIIDKRIRVSRPFCVGKVCNLECQTSSQVMTPWSFILISSGGLVHEEIFHSNHNTSFPESKMKLNILFIVIIPIPFKLKLDTSSSGKLIHVLTSCPDSKMKLNTFASVFVGSWISYMFRHMLKNQIQNIANGKPKVFLWN